MSYGGKAVPLTRLNPSDAEMDGHFVGSREPSLDIAMPIIANVASAPRSHAGEVTRQKPDGI
jgi:hypothetical protein